MGIKQEKRDGSRSSFGVFPSVSQRVILLGEVKYEFLCALDVFD